MKNEAAYVMERISILRLQRWRRVTAFDGRLIPTSGLGRNSRLLDFQSSTLIQEVFVAEIVLRFPVCHLLQLLDAIIILIRQHNVQQDMRSRVNPLYLACKSDWKSTAASHNAFFFRRTLDKFPREGSSSIINIFMGLLFLHLQRKAYFIEINWKRKAVYFLSQQSVNFVSNKQNIFDMNL